MGDGTILVQFARYKGLPLVVLNSNNQIQRDCFIET
jgi:hypothetical protein